MTLATGGPAGIGHNNPEHNLDAEGVEALERSAEEAAKPRLNFCDAKTAFVQFGGAAARDVTFARALADYRLKEPHLRALMVYSHMLNDKNGSAWPEPQTVADLCGCALKTIQNVNTDLVAWSYITRVDARTKPSEDQRKNEVTLVTQPGSSWGDWRKATRSVDNLLRLRQAIEQHKSHVQLPHRGKCNSPSQGTIRPAIPPAKETNSLLGNSPAQKARKHGALPIPLSIEVERPKENDRRSEVQTDALHPSRHQQHGKSLFSAGINWPTAIREAIESGKAPKSAATLFDTSDAALARGVEPWQIEASLRKSVPYAQKDAGDRDPTPGQILSRAIQFVERSDCERRAEPFAAHTAGRGKAINLNRDFIVPDLDAIGYLPSTPWED